MEYNLKNCESLYCTPVTYMILYSNYTSIKKNESAVKWEKKAVFKRNQERKEGS